MPPATRDSIWPGVPVPACPCRNCASGRSPKLGRRVPGTPKRSPPVAARGAGDTLTKVPRIELETQDMPIAGEKVDQSEGAGTAR